MLRGRGLRRLLHSGRHATSRKHKASLLIAAIGTAAIPHAAAAQKPQMLDEIRITTTSPIARSGNYGDIEPGTLPVVTNQFATVTVITADEILRRWGATLGDMLFNKPGITGSTYAPGGASRPIVRGLDNYRVRIQENGLATNDVSDLSEDHAVPIDPLAARQIEVIRGPATLRFGSQAIGGVVNVDNNRIPTMVPPRGIAGEVTGALSSADRGGEQSVLLDAGHGNFALHVDAFGRRAGDYAIPSYPYLTPPDPAPSVGDTQPNSFSRSNGYSVGGSYVFDRGFVGIAVSEFNSLYGIPGIEATETRARIDLKQQKVTSKGEIRGDGVIEAVRFWLGATDYRHFELADENGFDGIQQTFTNRAQEGRVEVQLAPFDLRFAALTTALGVQGAHQRLAATDAAGLAALFDPNHTTSWAGYIFNEFRFNDAFRAQIAGRIEDVRIGGVGTLFPADFIGGGADPVASDTERTFTPKSASAGLLHDLPFGLVASVTAQYVERAPRSGELFSRGPHEATATFEIGDPNLKIESAKTIEVGLRRREGPFRFEATAYHTEFKDFIFKRLTGNQCDDDFASCGNGGTELNQIVYSQRDATFRGAEVAAQLDVMPVFGGFFGVEGQYDVVRATFADGSNVPRIPPQRYGGGVFWRDANMIIRLGLLHADAQNDIAANETVTPSYNNLRAEFAYTTALKPQNAFGAQSVSFGIIGNNLLNDDIRNAASFKKDEVLLPGASVRGFVRLGF